MYCINSSYEPDWQELVISPLHKPEKQKAYLIILEMTNFYSKHSQVIMHFSQISLYFPITEIKLIIQATSTISVEFWSPAIH